HKKINYISKFIYEAKNISEYVPNFNSIIRGDIDFFIDNICKTYYDPGLLTNKGRILSTYNIFLENKDKLIYILFYIGDIDFNLSITHLKSNVKNMDKITYVEYKYLKKPCIKFTDIYHPFIDSQTAITNSLDLKTNILITGPNKS